jgi:hypothetical protein
MFVLVWAPPRQRAERHIVECMGGRAVPPTKASFEQNVWQNTNTWVIPRPATKLYRTNF